MKRIWDKARHKTRLLTVIMIVITVTIANISKSHAQDNPFKISNSLYSLYQKAYNKRNLAEGLQLADEMAKLAQETGDKKAECMAISIKMTHYSHKDNDEKYDETVETLKKKAKEYKLYTYYYFATSSQASRCLNKKQNQRALRIIKQIGEEAHKTNNHYGQHIFLTAMGNLYFMQGDYAKARNFYKEDIDFAEKNVKDQDISPSYLSLARCMDKLGDRGEAIRLVKTGITKVKNPNNIRSLYYQLCLMQFWMGQYDEYKQTYQTASQLLGEGANDQAIRLKALSLLCDGKTDEATETAMRHKTDDFRNETCKDIYVFTKQFDKAYPLFIKRAQELEQYSRRNTAEYQIADYNAQLVKDQLTLSQMNLQYELTRQELKANEEKNRIEAQKHENMMMKIANDSNTIARMRADSLTRCAQEEAHKAETATLNTKNERHRMVVITAICLFCIVCAYAYTARKRNKYAINLLQRKQKQLADTLDKAQEAERMKTMFVNGLGTSVKTPMNNILDLAEKIADNTNSMTDDDREKTCLKLTDTADKLTDMLNDILKNALKDSASKATHILLAGLLTIAAMTMTTNAYGQYVKDKLDRDLQPMYNEIQNSYDTPEGLKKAKQLYDIGTKRGNTYIQCVATSLQLQHYVRNDIQDEIPTTITRMKQLAQECRDTMLYYLAFSNEVNNHLNCGRTLTALKLATSEKQATQKNHDIYGLYRANKSLGDVLRRRRYYDQAITTYEEAYLLYLRHHIEHDPTDILINLARLFRIRNSHDDANYYLKQAETQHKIERSLYRIYIERAKVAFETNDRREFVRLREEMKKMKQQKGYRYKHDEDVLDIMDHAMTSDISQWKDKAKTVCTDQELLRIIEIYCKHNNLWEEACNTFQEEVALHRKKMEEVFENDREEMNELAGNSHIMEENMRMKIASANMMMEQTIRKGDIERFMLAKHRLLDESNQLTLNRLETEKRLQNAKMAKDQSLMNMRREREKLNQGMAQAAGGIAVVVMLFIMSYLIHAYGHKVNLKEKNAQLKKALQQVEESEQTKTIFIQNMSHEIRTPLNAIVGFSQLMSQRDNELSEEEKANFREIIRKNSELLRQLVDDVTSLSELGSGKYGLQIREYKVNELCRSTIATVAHRAKPDVPINFKSELDDDYSIQTDAKRLAQVVINYLTNAIKYTDEGSIWVECSSREAPGYVTIAVADTGVGVPADKRNEIFERFAKLDSFHQGTGLGLNICLAIAELLDAKVGVDPTYDIGARFYIALPVT